MNGLNATKFYANIEMVGFAMQIGLHPLNKSIEGHGMWGYTLEAES